MKENRFMVSYNYNPTLQFEPGLDPDPVEKFGRIRIRFSKFGQIRSEHQVLKSHLNQTTLLTVFIVRSKNTVSIYQLY